MSLWDTIVGWVRHDASKYFYEPIPSDRVTGATYDADPLVAGRDYFRIWITEMFIRRDRDWFRTWHPAVHSLVRCQFGSQEVEIPNIAGELKLPDVDSAHLEKVVGLNYPLTNLIPFNGGVVEVLAGLLALQGEDYVKSFVKVLGEFASLLAVPQLSAVVSVAAPIASGIQELLGATSGQLHLGLHQAFTGKGGGGANELRAGYVAVVLASSKDIDAGWLRVNADRLRYGGDDASSTPFTSHAHLLLRIEKRTERDDWEGLGSIMDPFNSALEALGDDEKERAESLYRSALAAAMRSPDLTIADRRRVAQGLKARYEEVKDLGLGAVDTMSSIGDAIRSTMTADDALALGEPSFEQLLHHEE